MTEQGFPVTSRFRIMDSPIVLPGKCSVCGTVDRPVIDFNTTIPMYGAILICFSCISEAARGVGMIDKVELEMAQENLVQSLAQQLDYAGMIGVPRERYDAIIMAVTGLSDAILSSSDSGTNMVAGPHGEVQPPLFDPNDADDSDAKGSAQGDTGSPKQDDHITFGERPLGISSGRKHGSIPTI